jgi:uncharacterized membrane protein (UPF0127 family)
MREDWIYADEVVVVAPAAMIERVRIARTFAQRSIGLLAKSVPASDEGLMFVPGGSIHTFGMRYAIDIVFLSEYLDVLKVVPCLQPWRFAFAPAHTQFVLELASGAAERAGIREGELLYAVAKREQLVPKRSTPACAARDRFDASSRM